MNQWMRMFKSQTTKKDDLHILVVSVVKRRKVFILAIFYNSGVRGDPIWTAAKVKLIKGYICATAVGNVTDLGQKQTHNPSV